ncbi:MAG: VanZ family protein [Alicyclobacillaceae bacterium]|nr:VanZ family protein [Alicyclobacillaceae bacterium]
MRKTRSTGDGWRGDGKRIGWCRAFLMIVMLLIIYFSDRPDLRVANPATWVNPPVYRDLTPGYFLDLHSKFYAGYRNWTATEFILHKVGHIVGYSALTYFAYHSVCPEKRRPRWIWAGVALFALIDEIHQSFVAGRDGRLWDVGLDSAVSALMLFVLHRRRLSAGQIRVEGRRPGG